LITDAALRCHHKFQQADTTAILKPVISLFFGEI